MHNTYTIHTYVDKGHTHLFAFEHMFVEVLLELLVGIVNAKLLE